MQLLKQGKYYMKEYKVESFLLFITLFILTTGTAYSDFYATMRHGIEFWNVLFEGHPLQFYSHCTDMVWGNAIYNGRSGCAYDFSIYAVFAIWNFPIWIIEKISGANAQDNLLCVIWGKMLIVSAIFVSAKLVGEIYELISGNSKEKQKDFLLFNYLSSLLLLSYAVSTGNYDILAVVAMLSGIIGYLQNNDKKFLFWFIVAVTFKYFAIFIFLPLLLLKKKKVFVIIRDIILLISLSVAEKIIFTRQPINNISESAGGTFLNWVRDVTVAGEIEVNGIGTVSLLFILYAGLVIYCYIQNGDIETYIFKKKVIYICLCAWAIFFMFVEINSYWIVLIVPFLVLVLEVGNNKKISYMIETIFMISMFLILNMNQDWILGGRTCLGMLIHRILCFFFPPTVSVENVYLGQILRRFNEKLEIRIYLNSICLISMITFLILNIPKCIGEKKDVQEEVIYMRNRLLINIGVSLLPIMLYIYQIFYWNAIPYR